MKANFQTIVSVILFITTCSAIAETPPEGLYFGLTPPGAIPQVFAPGIISLPNRFEDSICLSADGGECYFTIRNSSWSVYQIYETHYSNGGWTTPAVASFSNTQSLNPCLADNDQNMYFSRSNDIWRATRTPTGWASPVKMASPVSSSQNDWSCYISSLGNAWICSNRTGSVSGSDDIWRLQDVNGNFTNQTNISALNTSSHDGIPVPGPNENYIIFNSNRPGGYGGLDLYISFANGSGGWTAPQNLGPTINTSGTDDSPYISPDYKYLFFTSNESSTDSSIYWVDIREIVPTMPDLNFDGVVDFDDLEIFADHWLTYMPSMDVAPEGSPDGIINFEDFAVFAQHWLEVIN